MKNLCRGALSPCWHQAAFPLLGSKINLSYSTWLTFTTPDLQSKTTARHMGEETGAQRDPILGADVTLQRAPKVPWRCSLWLTRQRGLLRERWTGGWGTYGVFLGPSEVPNRQQLPNQVCCRYRGGLQQLLWVTFITTINTHATHRHTRLGQEWHYEQG